MAPGKLVLTAGWESNPSIAPASGSVIGMLALGRKGLGFESG